MAKRATKKAPARKAPARKAPARRGRSAAKAAGGYKVLAWPEYLEELRLGTAREVERELLRNDYSAEDVAGFKSASYIVVDKVWEPGMNGASLRHAIREKRKPYPPGFVEESDEYFTKAGDEVFALVAIKGDGMPPTTVF